MKKYLYLLFAGLVLSACSQSFSSSDVDWNSQGVRVVTSQTEVTLCSDTAYCIKWPDETRVNSGIVSFSADVIEFELDFYDFEIYLDGSGNTIAYPKHPNWAVPTILDFNDEWIVIENVWTETHPRTGVQWTEGRTTKYFFK